MSILCKFDKTSWTHSRLEFRNVYRAVFAKVSIPIYLYHHGKLKSVTKYVMMVQPIGTSSKYKAVGQNPLSHLEQ